MGRFAQPGAVSIVDVARVAGVSTSTVSRVITKHPRVRPSTQQRVEEVMRELGYRPNALARGLLSGRSHTLGLVVYGLHNPFFGLLAHGVEVAARARGYNILIGDSADSVDQQEECLVMFAERRVDGVIIAPIHAQERELAIVRSAGIKAVLLNARPGDDTISSVGTDDVRNGRIATRHLVGLGHRRIGFLGHRRTIPACQDRLQGYRQAHEEAGIPSDDPDLLFEDLVGMEAVRDAVHRLLDLPAPPTAILAINDEYAIAVLQALSGRRRRVPDDVALVSFDDIPVAAWLSVPLTTVALPIEETGRIAANLLIDQIEQPKTPVQHVLISTRLVVRQSCGALRGEKGGDGQPAPTAEPA